MKYLCKRILFRFSYCFYVFIGLFGRIDRRNPKQMSKLQTVQTVKEKKASLARFGDGEFYLCWGIDLPFQKYTPELSERLREIIRSTDKRILIGIPDCFHSMSMYSLEAKKFWLYFIGQYRYKVLQLLDLEKDYVNTNCTRFYSDYKDKNCIAVIKEFKSLWGGAKCGYC